MCFLQPHLTPLINESTLCSSKIGTLIDIVIANPTQVDLFLQFYTTQGFVASNVVQAKERNYPNQHCTDQCLLLAIEVSGFLHKHVNVFSHDCVNAIWNLKRLEVSHLSTLVIFLHQKVSITL
jgi:hypothetical protein